MIRAVYQRGERTRIDEMEEPFLDVQGNGPAFQKNPLRYFNDWKKIATVNVP